MLSEYKLLVKVKVKTDKEEKELSLSFDLPSSIYLPRILYRIRGQYVYLYNHLGSRISFVIGDSENPETDDYFVDDAMEELWHLAIYPHLIEKLNRDLRIGAIKPENSSISTFLMEGESVAKAFAFASFDEFKRKKGYDIPNRKVECKETFLVDKIRSMGIRKALKEVSRLGILCKGMS